MKICCISDTHGAHRKLTIPECDILVHAGDFSNIGIWKHVDDFFSWLDEQPAKHIVLIAGNHDISFDLHYRGRYFADNRPSAALKKQALVKCKRLFYLENTSATIGGLKWFGSPFSLPFFDWAFMLEEQQLSAGYWRMPKKVDVIISHTPPFGCLDKNKQGIHCGSKSLRKRVEVLQPKLVICGHIHEDRNIASINETTVINASIWDHIHSRLHEPVIVDV
jgi:Icc-related predicted phosphoesterase